MGTAFAYCANAKLASLSFCHHVRVNEHLKNAGNLNCIRVQTVFKQPCPANKKQTNDSRVFS